MFTPIHLLPQYNTKELDKYRDRWKDSDGRRLQDKILGLIRHGAGEDFLQWDFEQGNLGFLENMWDLKGIDIFKEKIVFPAADNFEGIDFSYGSFYHSSFKNATFLNTFLKFTKLYNCEFVNCNFLFTSFYGATLEKTKFINCDFIEHNSMTNCDLRGVELGNCFIPTNLFFDCKFDEQTVINNLLDKPLRKPGDSLKLSKNSLAEIFKGIKEGYIAGTVIKQARIYFFKERKAITRYNTKGLREKIWGYFLELIAGYGIKPVRVLLTMLTVFLISSIVFSAEIEFSEGILLSAGAFFTFGANTQYLQTLSLFLRIIYIAEAFFGVSLMALFITVLANLWFREK
jgi:uncharacterized protein YjbI with pentapeptide repeats